MSFGSHAASVASLAMCPRQSSGSFLSLGFLLCKNMPSPSPVVAVGKKERTGNIPAQQQARGRPSIVAAFLVIVPAFLPPNSPPPPSAIRPSSFFMVHFYASTKIPFLHSKNLSHSPRPSSDAACFGKRAAPGPPGIVNPPSTPVVPLADLSCPLLCFCSLGGSDVHLPRWSTVSEPADAFPPVLPHTCPAGFQPMFVGW